MADCESFWHMVLSRLAKRDYSKAELLAKVPPECHEFLSKKLDELFPDLEQRVVAAEVTRAVSMGKGPLYLKERLYKRRIDSRQLVDEPGIWQEALDQALQKARRKYDDSRKIVEFLLRQGFTYEIVREYIKEVENQ